MVLQDAEIVARLITDDEKKRIVITPLIDPVKQIGPSSVDVRLGNTFKIPMTSQLSAIDPMDSDRVDFYLRPVEVLFDECFYLHPGEFVLASTLEFIRVPSDLAGRLEGRSSWGRMGLLVHATAGFIDPGFSGSITFELFNAGKLPIQLKPGMRMAQLCFLTLMGLPWRPYNKRPGSKYNNSLFAEGSRIFQDF